MHLGNSQPLDLLKNVREFGARLADLLNSALGLDITMAARFVRETGEGRMGWRLDQAQGIPRLIPLPSPQGGDSCYLYLLYRLVLNDMGYLVVTRSAVSIYLEESPDSPCFFRYEFRRDGSAPYPDPHLHIEGASEALRLLNEKTGQKKGLGQLHFPLGGKRYRPSLEDFLEFMICEGFVAGKEGWQDAMEIYRSDFYNYQLAAATKDDPATAIQALEELGYKVKRPKS